MSPENCVMVGRWTGPQKDEAVVSYSEHLARLPMASVSSLALHIFYLWCSSPSDELKAGTVSHLS